MDLPLLPLLLDNVPAGLRMALEQEGIPFLDRQQYHAGGALVLHDSRNGRLATLLPGQTAIDVHSLRSNFAFDPYAALTDDGSARCSWRLGDLEVSEEVARFDKRLIRYRLLTLLQAVVEGAGGVWLRIAPYPFPYRSAFNFRLDHDEYDADDFSATLRAIAGAEDACSHYVCASTHAGHPEAVARLRGFDVGSHGYWHHTYRDAPSNLSNIRRGIEALQQLGIEPSGFAAPHGRFNRGFLAAIEQLGVTHSSEFGLAYDELPFVPSGGAALQIPIHPICLGICLEAASKQSEPRGSAAKVAVSALLDHFHQVATAKYEAGEPIFFYGHPDGRVGRYPQVLREALAIPSQFSAVWRTTLTGFAEWWRARSKVQLTVQRDGQSLAITAKHLTSRYQFAVEYMEGNGIATVPVDGDFTRIAPRELTLQTKSGPSALPERRLQKSPRLRSRVLRCLDWEKVTPLEEIRADNWRGWAKRSLRRVRR